MIRAFAALLVVALAALPLRAIVAHPTSLSVVPSLQVDAAAYDAIAAEIVQTRSLAPIPPLQPPGFVLMVAAVYAVAGHSWVAAKVFLWLVFCACILMSAQLAWRLYGEERHAWIAAVLTASAPALRGYTGTIQYELIAAAWLLALLNLASRARVGAVGACVALGAMAAAATLTREVLLATVPVLATYVAHQQWQTHRSQRALACALLVLSSALLPVAGWAMLQSGRSDRIVMISDKGPLVMAFGNNPLANGTFNAPLVGVGTPAGLAFMGAQPTRAVELMGRKFLYFWGVLRDGWNVPRPSGVWLARAAGGTVPLEAILPLVRGGGWLVALVITLITWPRARWRRWWVLPGTIAAVASVHLLTVSSHRFAVPVLPVTLAIIAGPLARAATWLLTSRRRWAPCVCGLAAMVAMQRAEWPVRYSLDAAHMDGLNAANAVDPEFGLVRVADAARGRRAALLLSDEALPHGRFDVVLRLRAAAGAAARDDGIVIARLETATQRLCELTVTRGQAPPGQWIDVTMPCTLHQDDSVTIVVDTTGAVDVAFQSVQLRW
ncbi:MAG: hypothetical protein H0T71_11990 [Acidobacteria bacterium]|nr:hypothetical protein [Acidobacteriota bacterium]